MGLSKNKSELKLITQLEPFFCLYDGPLILVWKSFYLKQKEILIITQITNGIIFLY